MCDDEVIENIAPHVEFIADRLVAGTDAAELCREVAPKAGLTPGQVWAYVQQMLVQKKTP